MKTITVYDPAMCCSTGICGAEVDQTLVTFAADLDWLKSQGVGVTRINLSQEPAAFATNETVKTVLEKDGVGGLPVVFLGSDMQSSGRYPSRGELAEMTGVVYAPGAVKAADTSPKTGCCGGGKKAEGAAGSCC